MPPKKRAAPAAAASSAAAAAASPRRAKRVRVGETSIIGASSDSREPVHPSGRPKRSTDAEPSYNTKRARRPSATNHGDEDATLPAPALNPEPVPVKKGRGRPPNNNKVPTAAAAAAAAAAASDASKFVTAPAAETTETGKRSVGRPSSRRGGAVAAANVPAPAIRKSPGRPKKSDRAKFSRVKKPTAGPHESARLANASRTRGRPAKKTTASKAVTAAATDEDSDLEDLANGHGEPEADIETGDAPASSVAGDEEDVDEVQYWLMKAEPESRMEHGVDVKFSIDDLMNAAAPEPWDGVRNYVARNNMRAMKKGDLAFFYHSNCKVPGIAGVMKIVQEHSIDETAFDHAHPYYDDKSSRDNPKWEVVHVSFVRKFAKLCPLKELQSYAGAGGVLGGMQMLQQSRLSVSAVTPMEWKFIMEIAADDEEDLVLHPSQDSEENQDNDEAEPVNGQEGDGGPKAAAVEEKEQEFKEEELNREKALNGEGVEADDVDRETTNIDSNIGF